jgi:hypothetical protein
MSSSTAGRMTIIVISFKQRFLLTFFVWGQIADLNVVPLPSAFYTKYFR